MSRCKSVIAWSKVAGFGLLWAITSSTASAALGEGISGPAVNAAPAPRAIVLKSQNSTAGAAAPYAVSEVTSESGTTVKEFSRPDGVVFALAWRGPVLPDLNGLLGAYFETFRSQAAQLRASGKRGGPVNINTPELVVLSGGHMRQFFGHAYAPALVPANVMIQNVLP